MPYKDEYGIWRHDKPQIVGAELRPQSRYWRVLRKQNAFLCETCGTELESDGWANDGDEFDEELAAEWGVEEEDWDNEYSTLFCYVTSNPYCPTCFNTYDGCRAFYYNPRQNCYNLPAPLTRAEVVELERLDAEIAGQLAFAFATSDAGSATGNESGGAE